MGKLSTIKNRIYSDFLMSSRLDEYDKVIKSLVEAGYEHITFIEYNQKLKKKYFRE